MSTKSKVIVSGVLAAIIAVALIGAVVFTPGVVNTSSTSSTSISTSSSSANAPSGSGTLAVLMTDPPTVPDGVTAVYINYSSVEIHIADAGNQSGWTDLQTKGEINLMSIVNESQTIASTNISSGKFNGLRFNVTSSVVTFQGKNYTADLVYQEHTLYVWIPGGVIISDGQTTGAMIDMTPTVLLLGNTTNPTFAFIPAATGYTLSANSIVNHPHKGDRDDYNGKVAEAIQDMIKFQLSAASLSPNSLSVTVKNDGNATVIFRMAALTGTSTPSGGWVPSTALGPISKTSEFFVVAPNGSLLALSASSKQGAIQTLALSGFSMAPGSSATFTYNGAITIGALALLQGHTPTHGVVAGQKYIVTVLGSGEHAQTAVIASGPTITSSTTTHAVSTSSATTTSSATSSQTSATSSSATSSDTTTTSATTSTGSTTTTTTSTVTSSD